MFRYDVNMLKILQVNFVKKASEFASKQIMSLIDDGTCL